MGLFKDIAEKKVAVKVIQTPYAHKTKKEGLICTITVITDSVIKGTLSNGKEVYISSKWVNNAKPGVLYSLLDDRVKTGIVKIQYPLKVYNYWTPFKIGKKVYVELLGTKNNKEYVRFIKGIHR